MSTMIIIQFVIKFWGTIVKILLWIKSKFIKNKTMDEIVKFVNTVDNDNKVLNKQNIKNLITYGEIGTMDAINELLSLVKDEQILNILYTMKGELNTLTLRKLSGATQAVEQINDLRLRLSSLIDKL